MSTPISVLTIFTESVLESKLLYDLERLGAPGYTVTSAWGKGQQGSRSGSWQANSNIRVEVICETEFAKKIAIELEEKYYDNFAMVVMMSPVEVLRPEKFKAVTPLSQSD